MSESKTVQIRDMNPELWRRIKSRAADMDVPVKELVSAVLFDFLKQPYEPKAVNAPNEVRPA